MVPHSSVVELRRVSKTYGTRPVVHDVDLAVYGGELLALLGPSGGGKTTLIRLIAGFIAPTAGRVLLGGKDVTYEPAYRRDVGVVFQNYALFPHLTVRGNIAFGLKLRHYTKAAIEARLQEMLSLVQLSEYGDAYPRHLSGGQQQRVALARALAVNPKILLLDEPLSNLDANLRQEVGEEMKRLQRATQTTTLLVTHDRHEAFGLADRVAILEDGTVAQTGTPSEIYRRPKNRFVARFVGPANFIPGTLVGARGSFLEVSTDTGFRLLATGEPETRRQVEVMVRPEEVELVGDRRRPDNVLSMTVSDAFFYGEFATVHLDGGGLRLTATLRGRDTRSIRTGAVVDVGWDAHSAYVFQRTESCPPP